MAKTETHADEQGPVESVLSFDIETRKVRKTVKTTVDGKVWTQVWTMDFSKCTDRDMLDLASRTFVIDLQAKFKAKTVTDDQRKMYAINVIDVKENMGSGTAKQDAVSKTVAVAKAKLTPEQRAELIKQLQAMDG